MPMIRKLARSLRRPRRPVAVPASPGPNLVEADRARDASDYAAAAHLYAQALLQDPNNAALHIQCGHMCKEAGWLDRAETHYRAAYALIPGDADLNLQLGHFLKVAGRLGEAASAYQRALALEPGWADPARELAALAPSPALPAPRRVVNGGPGTQGAA